MTGCERNGCEHIHQEVSLPTAVQRYQPWTDEEIDFLRETLDEPLGDVAAVLNRTYYAVAVYRSKVKRGLL
jgi:hypothetical protein